MENRKKFYSGSKWDTLQKRFEYIQEVLKLYNRFNGILDDQDLMFAFKNAFVSKIYVSEDVAKAYPKSNGLFGNLSSIYDKLINNGVLDIQDCSPYLNCQYLELGELGTTISRLKKNGTIDSNKPSVRIEHVVPGNEYFKDIMKIQNFNDFKDIFDVVCICLVTEKDDKKLCKGLKRNMPKGVDYKKDPFARYTEAKVKIYSRKKV